MAAGGLPEPETEVTVCPEASAAWQIRRPRSPVPPKTTMLRAAPVEAVAIVVVVVYVWVCVCAVVGVYAGLYYYYPALPGFLTICPVAPLPHRLIA
jgi:hypothetical protein